MNPLKTIAKQRECTTSHLIKNIKDLIKLSYAHFSSCRKDIKEWIVSRIIENELDAAKLIRNIKSENLLESLNEVNELLNNIKMYIYIIDEIGNMIKDTKRDELYKQIGKIQDMIEDHKKLYLS